MKKINFSYITNNKKIFNGVKLVCIGAALSFVTSCTNVDMEIGNDLLPDETVPDVVVEEPILQDDESNINIVSSVSEDDVTIQDNETKINIEQDVDANNEDEKKDITKEQSVVQEVIAEESKIDISSIVLSNNKVSTYNTDFELSQELQNEINGYINSFGASCSFLAINLNDGMSFGYNIDATYQTASTIKAPFSLYSFKEMDQGNGSLEELKEYEERFRRDGSGILKDKKSGTFYSLKDLFYYTINYSDNVAYYMVYDRFYSEAYNEFLKGLGCNNLYLYNGGKWGFIDARSMALVWQEIYKYKDETENGKYLFELLTNAEYNYIREGMDKYESAHKSGWTPRETHDAAIVFAEDDYIVVILNNNNGNYTAKSQLLKLSECIEKGIDEYTFYKKQNKEKVFTK